MLLGAKPRQGCLAWARALRPLLVAAAAAFASSGQPTPGAAEPVLDRALSGLRLLSPSPTCTLVKIEFNFRIRYVSHFPLAMGEEIGRASCRERVESWCVVGSFTVEGG